MLPARELIEAIGRVCLVAGPHAPVRLSCQPGSVRVSAGEQDGAEGADAEQELPAEVSGEPVLVSVIPAYLLDGLPAAGTEVVRLSVTQSGKPAMVIAGPPAGPTGTPGFRYLAMSLRVR